MNSQMTIPWDALRDVDALEVAERLGLQKHKGKKYACIACASSDAFHIYPDSSTRTGRGAHCFSCHRSFSSLDMVMEVLELDIKSAAA